MQPQQSNEQVASILLSDLGSKLKSCNVIQQLWAGYGHICRLEAVDRADTSNVKSLILKCVTPPASSEEPFTDEGYIRKVLSYQVEQYFYTQLAPLMPKEIAIAFCLASSLSQSTESNSTAMILSDLRLTFPVAGDKRSKLNKAQTYAALTWFGDFHGFWWDKAKSFNREDLCRPPLEHVDRHNNTSLRKGGVWLNGGYTYLSTRRTEYNALCADASEWSGRLCKPLKQSSRPVAELAASFLSPSNSSSARSPITDFETLIHGDVKSENLFTTTDGMKIAFFDFQYVGLGLGVCDLAKLFTCSVQLDMLTNEQAHILQEAGMHEKEEGLLRRYISSIEERSGKQYPWDVFVRHWETALVDWLRFQASWGFWGNTEWLEARVRSILQDETWIQWLSDNTLFNQHNTVDRIDKT